MFLMTGPAFTSPVARSSLSLSEGLAWRTQGYAQRRAPDLALMAAGRGGERALAGL